MDLLKYIPHSRNQAVSRFKLADIYGVPERAIRLEIERLRREGYNIIPSPKGGYYIADDINEIEAFLKTIDSRMKSEYLTYLPMRKKVAAAKGKRITKVREHFRRLGMGDLEGQQRIEGVM